MPRTRWQPPTTTAQVPAHVPARPPACRPARLPANRNAIVQRPHADPTHPATHSPIAMPAVLENRHVACLYSLLLSKPQLNIFSRLDAGQWREVRGAPAVCCRPPALGRLASASAPFTACPHPTSAPVLALNTVPPSLPCPLITARRHLPLTLSPLPPAPLTGPPCRCAR